MHVAERITSSAQCTWFNTVCARHTFDCNHPKRTLSAAAPSSAIANSITIGPSFSHVCASERNTGALADVDIVLCLSKHILYPFSIPILGRVAGSATMCENYIEHVAPAHPDASTRSAKRSPVRETRTNSAARMMRCSRHSRTATVQCVTCVWKRHWQRHRDSIDMTSTSTST